MANGNGLTAAEMIVAITEADGYVTKASHILKCSRGKFYTWLKKYPTVQQALENIREDRHEYVENQLMKLIENGNITAIIFYLKTQAKHLGYVERQEITGKDGGAVEINTIEVIKDYGE